MTAIENKQTLAMCSGYGLQNSENSVTTICKVNTLMEKLGQRN